MNSFKPKLGRRNPVKTEGHFLLRLCSFAWLAEKILKRLAKLLSLFGHPKKRALPIEVGFDTKCCLEKEVHFLLAGWIISMICIPPTSKILNWRASIPALPNTWKCLGALNHPNRYLRAPKQQTNKRFPKHQSSQTSEFFRSFTLWQRTIPEIAFFNGSQCRFWILKKIPPQNPRSHPDPKHQVSVLEGGRGRFPPPGKKNRWSGRTTRVSLVRFSRFRGFRPDGFWGTPGEIREVCVCGKLLDMLYCIYRHMYVRLYVYGIYNM